MLTSNPLPTQDRGGRTPPRTLPGGEENDPSTGAPTQTPPSYQSLASTSQMNGVCFSLFTHQPLSHDFTQSGQDASNWILQTALMNSHRLVFNQEQVSLILSTILSRIQGQATHNERVENALASLLTSMQLVQSVLVDHSTAIVDIQTRLANAPLDRDAARDILSPVVRSEAATFQLVLVNAMTQFLSAYGVTIPPPPQRQPATADTPTTDPVSTPDRQFPTAGTHAVPPVPTREPQFPTASPPTIDSVRPPEPQVTTFGTPAIDTVPTPERQPATVGTPTRYPSIPHEHIMVPSATETEGHVAAATIAIETSNVPCDDSLTQPSTGITGNGYVEPIGESPSEPMQDARRSPGPRERISELTEDATPSTGPGITTPDLTVRDGDVSEDRPLGGHNSINTEGQGMPVSLNVAIFRVLKFPDYNRVNVWTGSDDQVLHFGKLLTCRLP